MRKIPKPPGLTLATPLRTECNGEVLQVGDLVRDDTGSWGTLNSFRSGYDWLWKVRYGQRDYAYLSPELLTKMDRATLPPPYGHGPPMNGRMPAIFRDFPTVMPPPPYTGTPTQTPVHAERRSHG